MSRDVESEVAAFLDRRDRDPTLTPEAYVAELDAPTDAVLAAIRRSLGVEHLLSAAVEDRPDRVGPYRVEEELGRGAMGVVYAVEREGRRFALKLWSPGWALGRQGSERFEREARTLARLSHPGIVRIHDSGVEARCPYLVMDLVAGRPLSDQALPLEPRRAVAIVAALAQAVAAAHAAGVLHRDVKPRNVVLRDDDRPVLLDFGLVAAEGEETLTATGALLGTPRYMAPEQARGEPARRGSDVFALGLILAELLLGAPVRGDTSRDTLLRAAMGAAHLPPSARALDPGLRRVIGAALAQNPSRRPGAAALAADLEGWLDGRPPVCRPPGWTARLADAVRARPLRTLLPAAAGVAAILLVLALLGAGRDPARAERHADLAVCAWILGAPAVAEGELTHALRHDDRHPVARAFEREPGAWSARAAALPGPARHGSLAGLQRHAGRAADPVAALAEVERLRREFPRAASLACVEARLFQELGAADGAAAERARAAWERAVELAPTSGPVRAGLAEARLLGGDVERGLAALLAAGDLLVAQGADPRVRLRAVIGTAPDTGRLRGALERALDERSDSGWLWYLLGYSSDREHALAGAERAYRRAIEVQPSDLMSALHLAHLHAGAQIGACKQCDEAFAAHPEFLRAERATELLLGVLQADHGRGADAMNSVIRTGLDLERRFPDVGAARALLERAEGLLARGEGEVDPGARERLREVSTRMRWALGE